MNVTDFFKLQRRRILYLSVKKNDYKVTFYKDTYVQGKQYHWEGYPFT